MGVLINHGISFLTSPIAVSLALAAAGIVLTWRRQRKPGLACFAVSTAVLWIMASGWTGYLMGMHLERMFPPQRAEEMPQADAIVVLGGGVGGNTNLCPYAELYPGADRVVHAARLWKAGRAPVVVLSGTNEVFASAPFLRELGVPASALRVENESGNTEQNARFVSGMLKAGRADRPTVLLVTSAWHMRRALLMFRKYAPDLEIVPAACDHETTVTSDDFSFWKSLLPNADALYRNSALLKEYIGYWGYRILR